MIKLAQEHECTGCSLCSNICPTNSILMVENKEGFISPSINMQTCIKCKACERECPIISPIESKMTYEFCYGCFHKNEKIRKDSSSGGVFSLLATRIIQSGGLVAGAIIDECNDVRHILTSSESEIIKMRGSKYVQSDLGDLYQKIKYAIDEDKTVLFSGTPCQVAAVRKIIHSKRLITVDLICHGIPSKKNWEIYKKNVGKEYKSDVKSFKFRYKLHGWANSGLRVDLENGKTLFNNIHEDPFLLAFNFGLNLRLSCYDCKFKGMKRFSDITIADFWGVEKVFSEWNDDQGVSLVITNTTGGDALFQEIKKDLVCKETSKEVVQNLNQAYFNSMEKPYRRDLFLNEVNDKNYRVLLNKCLGRNRLKEWIKFKLKKMKAGKYE